MTLQQMRYLVEIAKSGSINKAAKALYISQPSLSKAIARLESELGIAIFRREGRTVRFTADGEELLRYARQQIELEALILERFRSDRREEPVRLSVSSQHYAFTTRALIQFIHTLGDRRYELHLREGKTSEVIEDVFQQRSMLGVIYLAPSTAPVMRLLLQEKGIAFHPLQSFVPHVFLGKHHPLAQQSGVTLEQLAAYPCISYEQDADSSNFAEEIVSVDSHHQVIYVRDRYATINLLRHTLCYNIGTGSLLPNFIDDKITSIPLTNCALEMEIGWIILQDRIVTPDMQSYLHYLQESLALGSPALLPQAER